jgi:FG-GAP-like repeat/Domain of unknown function DUF11
MRRLVTVLALGAFFAIAVSASAAGSLFTPYQAYAVGSWPEAVAIGDVTGDGRPDVVMTTSYYFDPANDYSVFVFAQTATGDLAAPVRYASPTGADPDSVAIGDITGDGRKDVVVGIGSGVEVYPQLAAGGLGAPAFTATSDSQKIRLGRLDGNSTLDVAGVGWGTNTVTVLLNNGLGGFGAPVQYPAQHAGYEDLEAGDVTGDGRDDIVVMSGQLYAVPNISVLPQLTSGGFGPAATYSVGTNVNTQGIGLGDVTGDGRNDVVASYGGNRPSSFITVFAQKPSGTLAAPVAYPSYDIPEPVDVADVDGDARKDVVTLHGGWNNAGVYRQSASGGLAVEELYAIPYASHYNPHGLAVGDVSGDGRADVVEADYNHGLVVLRGAGPPPSADLAVAMTGSATKNAGKRGYSFSAAVSNAGPSASTASLTVTLSGPASSPTVNSADCSISQLTVTCSFAGLPGGASRGVTISGAATAGKGTIFADASVTGSVADPNSANDRAAAAVQIR